MGIQDFILIFLSLKACNGQQTCEPAVYTWPLGSGIEATEVENNVTAGSIGDVTYGAGPVSMDYQTVELKGDNNSFVDLRVENTSALWDDGLKYNYCFQMYVYLKSTTSGTLFHFLSDAAAPSNQILDILVFIENGNIIVVYENFASNTYVFDLSTDVWYHMIFERNLNSGKTTILIDRDKGTSIGKTFSGFNSKLTAFPGSVRIGGTFDQSRAPLRGRVACFQIIPGLEPIDLSESCMNYDADCITSAWPLAYISSSSTTTNGVFSVTSVPAGYSTGSSAPAVYYTGYAAGLGYSTGSSATAGHSTGSSASAGYSTGSSLSPVVSTTITTTSPTPPSSTSTYTTVTVSTSSSPECITAYDIKDKCFGDCRRYTLLHMDRSFASPESVIGSRTMSDVRECSLFCSGEPECAVFNFQAAKGTDKVHTCIIGRCLGDVVAEVGSAIYTRTCT